MSLYRPDDPLPPALRYPTVDKKGLAGLLRSTLKAVARGVSRATGKISEITARLGGS